MNELKRRLNEISASSFARLGLDATFASFQSSQRPDLSDFQCNAVLPLAKQKGVAPRSLATEICQELEKDFAAANLNLTMSIDGPGFINVKLANDVIAEALEHFIPSSSGKASRLETVIIDYGGPNVAKSLHVGHIRTSIVGESIKRILRAQGHTVYGDIHWGDWGTQMGILIACLEEQHPDWPYFNNGDCHNHNIGLVLDDFSRIYPQGAARFKAEPDFADKARKAVQALQNGHSGYRALWQQLVDVTVPSVKSDLGRLNVDFDLWLGESTVNDDIPEMLDELKARGLVYEDNGALIFPVARETDKHDIPPLILVKSGGDEEEAGGYTYATTDLATIRMRMRDYKPDRTLYVIDSRQSLHLTQFFRAAVLAGYCGEDQLEFLGIGTINDKEGKPFKTRAGGVLRLTELLDLAYEAAATKSGIDPIKRPYDATVDAIAIAALKFQDMRISRTANYNFDPDAAVQHEGKTGPYIQYAAARIKSIQDKAKERFPIDSTKHIAITAPEERALALQLLAYPDALAAAASKRLPSELCTYLYETSQAFSNFYQGCPVLDTSVAAEVRASRLNLIAKVLDVMEDCAHLIGFDLPARMPTAAVTSAQ